MIVSGTNICIGGRFRAADLLVQDGCIRNISNRGTLGVADLDIGGNPVLPGFVDVHSHGGDMIDVNHIASLDDIRHLARFHAAHGTTGFLASVMTDTRGQTESLLALLGGAVGQDLGGARLLGIHLEGPFLSTQYKGAMPQELLCDCDIALYERYQELSGGTIRSITVAPELPGALELIGHIAGNRGRFGVPVVSIGHSAADYPTAIAAIEAGARSATHMFNAMKLFHMHEPAISGACLERDEVVCEVICDGLHLHPATVRLILKTKGEKRVVAITDSIMSAGLPDGRYRLGVNDIVVKDGDARLPDGVRAGSTVTMDRSLRNLMEFTGWRADRLSALLSTNAADLLGLSDAGILQTGRRADFVVLDEQYEVLRTYVGGICESERGAL
jgi:N-acetylglucosamine-6-phosphate deacetylase